MMRTIPYILFLFSVLTFTACQKTSPSAVSNQSSTTPHQLVVSTDNANFVSDYSPMMSATMPRVDIYSDDRQMDFVTQPKDKKWGYTSCSISVADGGVSEMDSVSARVKVRGNSTARFDKKPLRIKFDEPQSMLGLHQNAKYKEWLLLACYKDWSMLRDACAFYLAHLMGDEYVSDFRLVNVYINDNYWGVYLLCEQQQTGLGRVDITLPDDNYGGTDIGYFVEFDGYYERESEMNQFTIDYGTLLMYHHTPFSRFQNGFTIKSDIFSEEQNTFIQNYMQNVFCIAYEAIYNEVYYEFDSTFTTISLSDTLTNSYETVNKVIDVDSWVNAYILAELTCDIDIAWSSFYMDVDFGEKGKKKLVFEAPWDFDSGYDNIIVRREERGLFASSIVVDINNRLCVNPWLALPFRSPWFKSLVRDKFNAMVEQKVFDKIYQYIDTVSESYTDDFAANDKKWKYVGHPRKYLNQCRNPRAKKCKTQKEAADYMKRWLEKRVSDLSYIFNTFE
jgi:hypothetical protein